MLVLTKPMMMLYFSLSEWCRSNLTTRTFSNQRFIYKKEKESKEEGRKRGEREEAGDTVHGNR